MVEFWHSQPGDGCLYYVVRPPWVKPARIETFFTLHPEERDWRTSFPVQQMAQERATQRATLKAVYDGDDGDSGDGDGVATAALHQAMARLGLQVAGMDAFAPSVPNTAR